MQQIIDGLWTFTGLLMGRVYAIKDADGLTLIDGSLPNAAPKILKQLQAVGFTPSDVKRIVLTHAHMDHVGAFAQLLKQTPAELIVPAGESDVVAGKIPPVRPDPATLNWLQKKMLPPQKAFDPLPISRTVNDGDVLPEIMDGLTCVFTPGHAPGHMAYWQPQRRVLFLGDVVMRVPNLRLPFRAFTVDMAQNIESLKRILQLKPDIVCFGHGKPLFNATQVLTQWAQKKGMI